MVPAQFRAGSEEALNPSPEILRRNLPGQKKKIDAGGRTTRFNFKNARRKASNLESVHSARLAVPKMVTGGILKSKAPHSGALASV
jgi:hypothetical protein